MTVLDAAHDYIKRGWGVVPLHGWDPETGQCRCSRGRFCPEKSGGKHPSTGGSWQNKALRSGPDVQEWYEHHDADNVGILTGPDSGIFVFDVDGASGVASVAAFAAEHGALPRTRIVRTGSGGLHYFFRHPGHFTVHNSTKWVAPGIDIRGKGGQVVAPPSISGRGPYQVIADNPLADPPDWLLDLLREHSENIEHDRTATVRTAEPVDVELLPERVRTAAATLVPEDEGRHRHFHHIVACCREAGYTQGETVTIVAPWCAAVDKFVGRVEAEVARCWGKLEKAAQKANDWLPGVQPDPTRPTPPLAAVADTPAPAATLTAVPDPADDQTDDDTTSLNLPPTWEPVDLTDILNGTYQPEEPGLFPRADGHCLVYPGRTHSFHGESESGKSLVVQAEAARLIGAGGQVAYIDFESDAPAVVGRLLDLGCPPDQIHDQLHYIRPDNDPRRFAHEREHFANLLSTTYDLVVIDGMTDALGTFGAGSADNDEIAEFMRDVPRRIARRTGAAVIVIDHVTKDSDSRGRYALGGQAKMNALDGSAFTVEVADALGRGLVGTITLRVAKDRPGGVRPHCGAYRKQDRTQEAARVVIDSTGDKIKVTVQAPHSTVDTDPKAAKTFRPTVLMERISDFLRHASEPVSQTVILEGVSGKDKNLKQALAVLIAEGNVSVSEGARKATLHALVDPYMSDEDPESDTYVGWAEETSETPPRPTPAHPGPDPGPDGRSDSGPPTPPPTGWAGVSGGPGQGENPTTPAPAAGQGQRPYDELDCNGCGKSKPAAIIETHKGYCSECARERR